MYGLSEDAFQMGRIIRKYSRQEISAEEQVTLDNWIAQSEENKKLFDELLHKESLRSGLTIYHEIEARKEDASDKMMEMTFPGKGRVRTMGWNFRRIAAAAAIALFVATGAFLLVTSKNEKPQIITETENKKFKTDKEPGKDGAILTLANGKEIILDSAANGLLTLQGESEVLKKDGMLSYSPSTVGGQGKALYNTLSTPRGRQFQLLLPDGSRLYLNAASSVRYPTVFSGKERVIEINGEAYLEIASLSQKGTHGKVPFIVKANDMEVEVLGTQFNVKAYKDEASISTTLIEGKVTIKSGSALALLTPGQQAIVAQSGNHGNVIRVVENADTEEAIAWKNGLIAANRATIKEALMQISRWYNVDLVFKNEIKEEDIRIRVPRTASLSGVLKIFELSSRLRFEMEGDKLIVWQQ